MKTVFSLLLFFVIFLGAASQPVFCYDDNEALLFLNDDQTAEQVSNAETDAVLKISAAQRVVILEVIDCLNNSVENRDLAEFLRGNFPGNKMMKEAADNLMFGRHNPLLAGELEKILEE